MFPLSPFHDTILWTNSYKKEYFVLILNLLHTLSIIQIYLQQTQVSIFIKNIFNACDTKKKKLKPQQFRLNKLHNKIYIAHATNIFCGISEFKQNTMSCIYEYIRYEYIQKPHTHITCALWTLYIVLADVLLFAQISPQRNICGLWNGATVLHSILYIVGKSALTAYARVGNNCSDNQHIV